MLPSLRKTTWPVVLFVLTSFSICPAKAFSQQNNDAVIAFDIRIDQLNESETFRKLLPDGELPGMFRMMVTVMPQRVFGAANLPKDFSFLEAERPPESMPFDFFAQFRLNHKDEAEDMADSFSRGADEKEIAGKKFFVNQTGVLIHQPKEKTVEVGVQKYLTAETRRLFTPRLNQAFMATPKVPIRIAMDLETQQDSVNQLIDMQIKQLDAVDPSIRGVAIGLLESFKNCAELRIGIGLTSENIVELEAIAYDAEQATELQEALDAIIFLGKTAATPIIPMIAGESQQLGDDLRSILKNASATVEGTSVKLIVPTPADFDKTLASVIDLGPMAGGAMGEPRLLSTKYSFEPIPVVEDSAALSATELREKFEQACFPGSGWRDSMSIEVDPLSIPNWDFYEFKYRVKSVKSKSGDLELHHPEGRGNRGGDAPAETLWFAGSVGSINLPLSLEKVEVKPEKDGKQLNQNDIQSLKRKQIGVAELEIIASAPAKLTMFELTLAEPRQEKDGVRANLKSISGSTAEISFRGEKLTAYAFDETGNRLAQESSFYSPGLSAVTFFGVPVKVVAIVLSKAETVTFDTKVDLNGGEQIRLPKKPSTEVRTRPSNSLRKEYQSASQADLDALEVKHEDKRDDHWPSHRFYVNFPKPNAHVEFTWDHQFFGESSPINIQDLRAFQQSSQIAVSINSTEEGLPDIRRAFGSVEIKAATEVEVLDFKKKADGHDIKMSSSGGKEFSVAIDKQQVTLPNSKDIIQRQFYDASGKRLRTDHPHSQRDGKIVLNCWGFPERVELTIRGEMISKKWDYEIPLGDTDLAAYQAFQKQSKSIHEIGLKLAELRLISQKAAYNHTVGGMHFVYGKGTKTPLNLIPEEIAQSDPKGAELFKYEVKPYKGYHFVFADKFVRYGKENLRVAKKKKRETLEWSGGTVKGYRKIQNGSSSLIAWPVDPADPVIYTDGQQIFHKVVEGGKQDVTPDYQGLRKDWTAGPKVPRQR